MKMVISINCDGPSFRTSDDQPNVEQGVIDILDDIKAQLESGVPLADLHGETVRGREGERAGAIIVSTFSRMS